MDTNGNTRTIPKLVLKTMVHGFNIIVKNKADKECSNHHAPCKYQWGKVVLHDGRLGTIPLEDECLAKATLKPITIITKVDTTWILYLDPNIVHPWWDLWVMGKKLLCELEWIQGMEVYLHRTLGRMLGRFRFLNVQFDWEWR